ncbi:hypothetical protein BJ508DRAFT_380731 [Ascobolus immersus RN42]|uniref:Uncharacterized protein n=1 Tax=Ascobolus immersus RN42 TaxID=1160509 RepID=A0A3N4HWS7_ASCIM|nr:hypothetical protein BJ508DRAFT_380731 [Ascobolus immersus RN42]
MRRNVVAVLPPAPSSRPSRSRARSVVTPPPTSVSQQTPRLSRSGSPERLLFARSNAPNLSLEESSTSIPGEARNRRSSGNRIRFGGSLHPPVAQEEHVVLATDPWEDDGVYREEGDSSAGSSLDLPPLEGPAPEEQVIQEQPVEIGSSPEGPAPDVSVIQDEIAALVDSMGGLVATGLGSGRRRSREDFESMDDLTSLMDGLSIEPKRRMAEKPSGACFQAPRHTWLAVILELLEGSGVEPDLPAADFVAWQGLYSHLQSLEECSQVLGDILEDIDRVVRYWRKEYLDSKSDALAGKPVDMAEERKIILTTALRNTHRLMKSYVDDSEEYKKIIHIPEDIRRRLIPLVQAIKVQRTQLESAVLIVWHFFGKEALRNFWMEFVVNLISNLIFNHSFKTMASSSVFVSRRLPTRSSSRISSRLGARQTVSPAASSRGNTPSQAANRVTKNPTTPPKNAKPPANSQTAPKKVRWDPSVPAPDDIKRMRAMSPYALEPETPLSEKEWIAIRKLRVFRPAESTHAREPKTELERAAEELLRGIKPVGTTIRPTTFSNKTSRKRGISAVAEVDVQKTIKRRILTPVSPMAPSVGQPQGTKRAFAMFAIEEGCAEMPSTKRVQQSFKSPIPRQRISSRVSAPPSDRKFEPVSSRTRATSEPPSSSGRVSTPPAAKQAVFEELRSFQSFVLPERLCVSPSACEIQLAQEPSVLAPSVLAAVASGTVPEEDGQLRKARQSNGGGEFQRRLSSRERMDRFRGLSYFERLQVQLREEEIEIRKRQLKCMEEEILLQKEANLALKALLGVSHQCLKG